MNTYSHSKLSCFEQCPLKFKFNYIDKVETEIEDTVEAFLGSRVHEALRKLYFDLKFQKLNTIKELLDFYNDEWKKNWNDNIIIIRKDFSKDNFRRMGEKYLIDYYERYKPFNHTKTIGLETEDFVNIGNNKIHVRIDRLALAKDGAYEIHDYKTSNSLPTQDDVDSDRQLAVYAYGVKTMYPDASEIRLIWHYLAFDKEMQSKRTDKQLEKLRQDVLKVIKEVEACRNFPSKESALCQWCEFRPICPNFKHIYALEKMPLKEYSLDDGVKLANQYAALSAEMKENEEKLEELKEELLKFSRQKGLERIYGSDISVSVKSYPKLSFPKKEDQDREQFIDMIKKIGLWDQLATVDVYELTKMINNKEIADELLALIDRFISKGETIRINVRKK